MGRLIPLFLVLVVLVGCKPDHDLTPLEAAVAGSWYHTYPHFHTPDSDQEIIELFPDRTGYWMVNRQGNTLFSNSLNISHWEVTNDTIRLAAVKPGYTNPSPNGPDVVVDTLWMSLAFKPLFISQDSLILKEICNLKKRVCDGVMTWHNLSTLEDMLTKPLEEVSSYSLTKPTSTPSE